MIHPELKRKILAAILGCATLVSGALAKQVQADTTLPRIDPPSGFGEGVQTELTPSQLGELLPWARNAETALRELLDGIRPLSMNQKRQQLVTGIQLIVKDSGHLQPELLMRYVLNRALRIYDLLAHKRRADSAPGTVDSQVRLLTQSVELARKYARSDIEFLSGHSSPNLRPTAVFAIEYAAFLMRLNSAILDASAQYEIGLLTLGFLQWDLYRDINRLAYAAAIQRISGFLGSVPENSLRDDQEGLAILRKTLKTYYSTLELLQPLVREVAEAAGDVSLPAARDEFRIGHTPSLLLEYQFDRQSLHEDQAMILDSSRNRSNGICQELCPFYVPGAFGAAGSFDRNQVILPTRSLKNSFGIEFWVRLERGQLGGFVLGADNRGRDSGLGISVGLESLAVIEQGTGYRPVLTQFRLITNRWNHIAISADDRSVTIYLNGVPRFAYRSTRGDLYAPTRLGWDAYGGYFQGIIDELVIFRAPLSADEVSQHYNTGKQALPESDL
ncbi:MAG: hypothetical protein A2428_07715 [Bdellovibrionales bacterium RIFOXYC1_FULL_54_43]|nr:MAG: hypothetical protein A2428_07715 [Bdellovibrionales bacterium RIFOXYC1_FULL_54_43]OFZ79521.1 MAG: hypothetical protein A2603_09940 [Bdellovibrionales bacterium RIFOXYD1_FULL_55_31]